MRYTRKIVLRGHPDVSFNFGLITCTDGFTMSVQAKQGAYCSPRNDNGPYTEVEVGFPSEAEPLLIPHIEMTKRWDEETDELVEMTHEELCKGATKQVYPWTPIDVVLMVIRKHGGRKETGKVFQ